MSADNGKHLTVVYQHGRKYHTDQNFNNENPAKSLLINYDQKSENLRSKNTDRLPLTKRCSDKTAEIKCGPTDTQADREDSLSHEDFIKLVGQTIHIYNRI